MAAPYSQSIHPKHVPKGLVVANLAVVRAHYCHFASNMLPEAFQMLPKALQKTGCSQNDRTQPKSILFDNGAYTEFFQRIFPKS